MENHRRLPMCCSRETVTMPQPTADKPFNPLDLHALGESLALALREQEGVPLTKVTRFPGAGVYALYYDGDCAAYHDLVKWSRSRSDPVPLYVGRSKDRGARRGVDPFNPVTDPVLADRIAEHRRSIQQATNLREWDFTARWLVTMPIWVPLAEAMLIRRYRPLWNGVVDGFGIHAPGGGRAKQRRSVWDTLHPGRGFAAQLPKQEEDRLMRLQTEINAHVRALRGSLEP